MEGRIEAPSTSGKTLMLKFPPEAQIIGAGNSNSLRASVGQEDPSGQSCPPPPPRVTLPHPQGRTVTWGEGGGGRMVDRVRSSGSGESASSSCTSSASQSAERLPWHRNRVRKVGSGGAKARTVGRTHSLTSGASSGQSSSSMREVPPNVNRVRSGGASSATTSTSRTQDTGATSMLAQHATLSSFYIDRRDVLRGVELRVALRRLGALWHVSPIDMPEMAREGLFQFSKPCDGLAFFLSHTWHSPGWNKYLSLLMLVGTPAALAGGAITLAASGLVTMLLPEQDIPTSYAIQTPCLDCEVWRGAVSLILVPMAGILTLLCSPALPLQAGRQLAFLDAVCIHQTDDRRKAVGIRSLGGFLASSDALVVLWSQPYFSRKWCIYEVAAFRAVSPFGEIYFRMVNMDVAISALFLAGWVVAVTFHTIPMANWDQWLSHFVLAVVSCVAGTLATHAVRRYLKEVAVLQRQLEEFDLRDATCREVRDSLFIDREVVEWYGSVESFNTYVQGTIRKELLGSLSVGTLPIRAALAVFLATVASDIDEACALVKAGIPSEALVSSLVKLIVWRLGILPLCCRLFCLVCERCFEPCSCLAVDVLISMVITILITGTALLADWAAKLACCAFHVAATIVMALAALSITWASYYKPLRDYVRSHKRKGRELEAINLPHADGSAGVSERPASRGDLLLADPSLPTGIDDIYMIAEVDGGPYDASSAGTEDEVELGCAEIGWDESVSVTEEESHDEIPHEDWCSWPPIFRAFSSSRRSFCDFAPGQLEGRANSARAVASTCVGPGLRAASRGEPDP